MVVWLGCGVVVLWWCGGVVEEVDNCQELGSVRGQGHNRAASTSICIVDKVLQSPRQAFTIHTMLKLKMEMQVI